ncbi:MAG: signal peptide peptidase SppA [Candidatus Babeliales bacterium]|jgi:protease-4
MESHNGTQPTKRFSFSTIIKNIFFIMLILQFTPMIFSGLKDMFEDALSTKAHVGYLAVNGFIGDSTYYIKQIEDFSKNPDIKALLLRINSPGGYSGSSEVVFRELKKFKFHKPIVAFIENTGASGAYYIAMAADSIVASPISLVGSIGVFMELPNVKDLLTSWKINYRYVQSGTYKTTGSMVKDLNAQELAYLQELSDDQYHQFVHDVAQSRKLNEKNHKIWADGKAFTGNQALKLKLVDKLGSFSDALDEVKRLIKTKEEIKLIQAKKPSGLMRLFGSDDELGQEMSLADHTASFLSNVCNKFSILQAKNMPQTC